MSRRILMIIALASPVLAQIEAASAQTAAPTETTATRPAKDPPSQTSAPTAAPPATTTQTTGASNPDPVVTQMNEEEKRKVESKGK